MDLSPKDLALLREMASGSLVIWAMVVLLLLLEWRLKRPGITWHDKWYKWLWVKLKLKKERVEKARDRQLKIDRVCLRVVVALLIISSGATALLFLFSGPKKLAILLGLIAWILIPFYISCHLVLRADKLALERMERMGGERPT